MRCVLYVVIMVCCAVAISAQTVQFKGRVQTVEGKAPIVGASVKVIKAATSAVRGGFTDARGRFTIKDLETGTYSVTVTCVGYESLTKNSVEIGTDTPEMTLDLTPTYIDKEATVVTASRVEESVADAPTAISVVDQRSITENPTQTPVEHLKGLPGVEFTRRGVSQVDVNTRGYNSVFSASLMVLSDFRITSIPSLRANLPIYIPATNDDIERIELVRGPGSALYGPNANVGVLNVITKSPFSSQGTSVSITGGMRSGTDIVGDDGNYYGQFGLRHAGTITDRVGYKVSAQYVNAWDWVFVDSVEQANRAAAITAGADPDTLRIGKRDNIHRHYNADARVDFLPSDDATISLSGGISNGVSAMDMTAIGASQGVNWMSMYGNVSLTWQDLFAQVFLNKSNSGESYQLRTGNAVIDNSSLIGARLQHHSNIGEWLKLTYGGDFFGTDPVTEGSISGIFEDNDSYTEMGAFLQTDVSVIANKLNLILAIRGDKHSVIEDVMISPRIALLYKLMPDQSIRATFNSAYSTPTSPQLFLDILSNPDVFGLSAYNPAWAVGAYGASMGHDGLSFQRDANGTLFYTSQFNRSAPMSLDSASSNGVWQTSTQLVIGGIMADPNLDSATKAQLAGFLSAVPATNGIQGNMANLDPATGTFAPTANVANRAPLKAENFQTFELGYQGVIEDKIRVSLDAYYTMRKDIISSSRVVTPSVFLSATEVQAYLKPMMQAGFEAQGVPPAQAEAMAEAYTQQLAAAYARIPVGTVSPIENPHKGDLLFASVNLGEIEFYGIEFGMTASVTSWMDVSFATNYISKNYWTKEEAKSEEDFASNCPQYRTSLGLMYRNPGIGLSTGVQWRWSDAFRVINGVYAGTVQAYHMVDLTAQYRIPGVEGLEATLSVTNLLDHRVQQWIGAASIGRLSTLMLRFAL